MPGPGTTESHDVRCIILSKQEHATHFELVLNVLLFVNRRCPHNPRTLNYWIDEDPFPFSYSSTYWDSWKVVEHHEIQCAKIGFSFPSERVIYLENNYASITYGQFFYFSRRPRNSSTFGLQSDSDSEEYESELESSFNDSDDDSVSIVSSTSSNSSSFLLVSDINKLSL